MTQTRVTKIAESGWLESLNQWLVYNSVENLSQNLNFKFSGLNTYQHKVEWDSSLWHHLWNWVYWTEMPGSLNHSLLYLFLHSTVASAAWLFLVEHMAGETVLLTTSLYWWLGWTMAAISCWMKPVESIVGRQNKLNSLILCQKVSHDKRVNGHSYFNRCASAGVVCNQYRNDSIMNTPWTNYPKPIHPTTATNCKTRICVILLCDSGVVQTCSFEMAHNFLLREVIYL